MEIDIISYSDAQYASLREEQIQEIKSAQVKKNGLTKRMEEEIRTEKARMINNGTFLSPMCDLLLQSIREKYAAEIEWLREGLLFYLRFSSKVSEEEASSNPYPLDYSLSDEERLMVVKEYYMTTYTDGHERFVAFKKDTVVRQYIGELYLPLYDYFANCA